MAELAILNTGITWFLFSLHKMEQMLKQVVRQSEELYGVFRQLESESARGEKKYNC